MVQLFKRKVRTLKGLYSDRELFSSQDMFSPPSERLSHVIRFELTTGCNWVNAVIAVDLMV